MTKRRKLTAEELHDAGRLQGIVMRSGLPQLDIAYACGWKSQGLVSQYTLGTIPLNIAAAAKLARVLGVSVGDFSPRLEQQIQEHAGLAKAGISPAGMEGYSGESGASSSPLSPDARRLIQAITSADGSQSVSPTAWKHLRALVEELSAGRAPAAQVPKNIRPAP